jgi:phosphinothricin acetyltransferase
VQVRDATTADLDGILSIYNEVIANTTAVYAIKPVDRDDRAQWLVARQHAGYPILVAVGESQVLGFASFGDFRGQWNGYRFSVEHSVHVRAECRGQGVGSALVSALFPRALAMGKHVMIGGIDAANAASLRFHARLGFNKVAEFPEVGHKFGRWLDLVFMQRFLDERGATRA